MSRVIVVNVVGVKDAFAGIGNLTLNVLEEIACINPAEKYLVYVADTMKARFAFTASNITVRPIRLPFNSMFSRIIWDQLVLPFYLLLVRPGLVVSMMNAACFLSPVRQVTYVMDLANIHMPERFSVLKRIYLALTMRLTLMCSTRIVTISLSTKKDIERYYPGYGKEVAVVYAGVGQFRQGTDGQKSIQDGRLPGRFFLFVSTLEPGKNIVRMMEAFKLFVQSGHADFKLLMAGSKGWFYQQVMEKIAELKLGQEIKYLGYVSDADLRTLYQACNGLVFVSLYEGFGLPILEAMQHGAPVLCSNTSSMPEVGGDAVLYCNPESVQDIYRGMIELSKQNRPALKQAYEKQLQRFTWKRSAEELNRVLRDLEKH